MRKLLCRTLTPAAAAGLLLSPAVPAGTAQHSDEHSPAQVPAGVILVKGAWSSASDQTTPVPEGGKVSPGKYDSPYFRITYPLPAGWFQKYDGPPPSDSGFYVLAQIQPGPELQGAARGTVLISAQDMFFTQVPANSAQDLVNYTRTHLQADYVVEHGPLEVRIGNHPFVRLDYWSPAAQLHWTVLATGIRCHTLTFTFTSTDTHLIGTLTSALGRLKLPDDAGVSGASGGSSPVCIAGYANGANVISRADPFLMERRYNPVPVRVIIGTDGKVRHIHFISAFPDQAKAITDALGQWRFKPYRVNGKASEVETGILFGRTPAPPASNTLISGRHDPQLVPARKRDPT